MSSAEKKDLESMRNENRIKRLEIELDKLKAKQQRDIEDMDSAIDQDNRFRDSRISNIDRDINLIENFIREKLAPGELEQFINHVNNNRGFLDKDDDDASSVASDDSFTGGRRKKKNKRKKKKKTRKKKGGKIPLKKVEEIKKKEHNPATHRRLVDEVGEVEPEVIIDILRVIDESDLELGSDSDDEGISGGGRRKKKTRKKRHRSKKKTKKKY